MKGKWIRVVVLAALLLVSLPVGLGVVRAHGANGVDERISLLAVGEGYNGPSLIWPFATGYNWKVTAGYNTYCHGGYCVDKNGDGKVNCLNPGPDQCYLDSRGDQFTFDLARLGGASTGQTVYAVQDGKIGPLNWMLQVYNDDGTPTNYYAYYGHLAPTLSVGTMVNQGDSIGTIDSQAHLHFGVARWNGSGAASANFPDNPGWIPTYFKNICGQDYPSDGSSNQYVNTVIEPCTPSNSTQPPNQPLLDSPANGSWSGSRTVTLSWHDGGDPDNQPRNYRDYYAEVWRTGWSQTLNWTTNTSWQVTVPGDGAYSWHVMAGDGAAGSAWSETRTFNVDTNPPTAPTITIGGAGCVGIQNNGWQNTCYDPAFTYSASDSGSDVKDYHRYWGTSSSGSPDTWTPDRAFDPGAIAAADGYAKYYLNLTARDNLDHESGQASFGVLYDGTVPTVTLSINDGAITTTQTAVLLHLSTADTGSGVAGVRISNNNLIWTGWQPYTDVIQWTLPALDRRAHTVYVQVRDQAHNASAVASDHIYLDLYPPMPHSASYRICANVIDAGGSAGITSTSYALVSAIGQPWATGATAKTSAGFAERSGFLDSISGCLPISFTATSEFTLTQSVVASGGNLRGSTSYRLGDTTGQPAASGTSAFTGTHYTLSSGFWANVTGTIPARPPDPPYYPPSDPPPDDPPVTVTPQPGGFGVSINDGALYTNDPLVTVRTWAPNITHQRLSNDGGYADEGWMAYRITTTHVLSTYGDYVLPRYVYAWFRDVGSDVYGPYFDDVIYDPVAPQGQIYILGGETATVTLWLEAWDDNSGVAEMKVSEDVALTGAAWQPFTNTLEWVLAGDVVYAQFSDNASNSSPIYGSDGSVHLLDPERIYLPLVLKN